REAVLSHSFDVDADADRGDFRFARWRINPDAGLLFDALTGDAVVAQCGDQHAFQLADVADDVAAERVAGKLDDGVADQLPRSVIGDVAAAIGAEQFDAAPGAFFGG